MAKFQESYLQAKTKKIIILAIIDFRYSKKEEVIHSIIFPVVALNQMLGGWGRTSVIHGSPDNAKQIRSKASWHEKERKAGKGGSFQSLLS